VDQMPSAAARVAKLRKRVILPGKPGDRDLTSASRRSTDDCNQTGQMMSAFVRLAAGDFCSSQE